MQKGTTSVEFFGSLSRKPPNTLVDLLQRVEKYIMKDDALMTNKFAKESRERDISRGCNEDRTRDYGVRRPNQGPRALNKYTNHRETNHQPRPLQYKEIIPLNVSIAGS